MTLSAIMSGVRIVQKSKMAAYKPDILITHLIGKIETRFQRLQNVFVVKESNGVQYYYDYYYYRPL